MTSDEAARSIFFGFNKWAHATVMTASIAGLLVSFILKYIDNFAKCFVAVISIICVALWQAALQHEDLKLTVVIGIVLTCMALEQFHLPQSS